MKVKSIRTRGNDVRYSMSCHPENERRAVKIALVLFVIKEFKNFLESSGHPPPNTLTEAALAEQIHFPPTKGSIVASQLTCADPFGHDSAKHILKIAIEHQGQSCCNKPGGQRFSYSLPSLGREGTICVTTDVAA